MRRQVAQAARPAGCPTRLEAQDRPVAIGRLRVEAQFGEEGAKQARHGLGVHEGPPRRRGLLAPQFAVEPAFVPDRVGEGAACDPARVVQQGVERVQPAEHDELAPESTLGDGRHA